MAWSTEGHCASFCSGAGREAHCKPWHTWGAGGCSGLCKAGMKRGQEAAGVSWSGTGMPRGASRQEPVSVYSASLINPAAGARAGGPALLVCD